MTHPKHPTDNTASPGRKPYESPAIVQSGGFETLAMTCTRTAGKRSCTRPPGAVVQY